MAGAAKSSKRGRRVAPPKRFRILLIGGGGREHALAWRLTRAKSVEKLWITHPNNPGLAGLGAPIGFPFDTRELYRVRQFCDHNAINMVVVGPEAPLAEGVADALASEDRVVFGPVRDGARLEADKAYAKQLMRAASIPTAEARVFTDPEAARAYIESRDEPQVIKAAGLAAGKGVIMPETQQHALDAVDQIMVERAFGDAGKTVVVEEMLQGPEASVLALVDGRTIWVLETCQDHKRLGDGDTGPNTGGMGAYCPADGVFDDQGMDKVQRDVLAPIVHAMRMEDVEYRGVLYAGLMRTPAGAKVLEFNVRFGDPECQPLMLRWKGDLAETLWRTATGTLQDARIDWDPRPACCVVLAAKGYPEKPEKGAVISGVQDAGAMEDVVVFHAGTERDDAGQLRVAGGRVLGVTALGETIQEARSKANAACDVISFDGMQRRTDIGAGAERAASKAR